jgi:hypothetical protein
MAIMLEGRTATPYLIEAVYMPGDPPDVLFFPNEDALISWLCKDIEHAYYQNDGHTSQKIYQYASGQLTELTVTSANRTQDFDMDADRIWICQRFDVLLPAGTRLFSFTVCFDGDA